MDHNLPEELVELVPMEMVLGLQPQMGVMVLWVKGETEIVQEKEPAAAEVAIRIQHFVALLFILKELKRLVSVLLYMEV